MKLLLHQVLVFMSCCIHRNTSLLLHSHPLLTPRRIKSFYSSIRCHSSSLFDHTRQTQPQRHTRLGNENDVNVLLLRGGDTSTSMNAASSPLSSFASSTPPLYTWIISAMSCAFSYACYNLSIKKASSSIDHLLGGVLLQIVASTLGIILFTFRNLVLKGSSSMIPTQRIGVIWSIIAGIAVGLAEITSFYVNSKGVPATQSIPIIIGGSVLCSTVLGRIWLKELISVKGWIGIVFITLGIAFTAAS